jgi:hypothetical protein
MENVLNMPASESSMLKYCKVILDKMSFDKKLLRKEYRKSLKLLKREECAKLKEWMHTHFRINRSDHKKPQ